MRILLFSPLAVVLSSSVVPVVLGAMRRRPGSVGYVCLSLRAAGFGVHALGFGALASH